MLKDLGIDLNEVDLILIQEETLYKESTSLIDQLLDANRNSVSLQALRRQASQDSSEFTLEDGLLLYTGRLVVPAASTLRTQLIREVHSQVSTAHPGCHDYSGCRRCM